VRLATVPITRKRKCSGEGRLSPGRKVHLRKPEVSEVEISSIMAGRLSGDEDITRGHFADARVEAILCGGVKTTSSWTFPILCSLSILPIMTRRFCSNTTQNRQKGSIRCMAARPSED
jgi:hypothetical protein